MGRPGERSGGRSVSGGIGVRSALAALALCCSGCSLFSSAVATKPCETPPPSYVILKAQPRLNPDDKGISLPTQVRLIQLKETTALEGATFRDLWENDTFLKEDAVQQLELTLMPGTTSKHWVIRNPKARYLLAIARVRKPLGSTWRAIYELRPVPDFLCRPPDPRPPDAVPTMTDERVLFRFENYQVDLVETDTVGQGEAKTMLEMSSVSSATAEREGG